MYKRYTILFCVNPDHLDIVLNYLAEAGFNLDVQNDSIRIYPSQNYINPVDMITGI